MRKISSLLIAALSLLSFCNSATAQKDTSVYKTWDDLLARVKKEKKTNLTNDPKLKAMTEQWSAGINRSIAVKPSTEPWKEWTPNGQRKHGEIDLLPLMEEAPAPVYTLPIAGQM